MKWWAVKEKDIKTKLNKIKSFQTPAIELSHSKSHQIFTRPCDRCVFMGSLKILLTISLSITSHLSPFTLLKDDEHKHFLISYKCERKNFELSSLSSVFFFFVLLIRFFSPTSLEMLAISDNTNNNERYIWW